MSDYRLFVCGMTSAGKEANLRALVEPLVPHIQGLQWTFNLPRDEGADYLESRAGEGRIVYVHWSARHGSAMTQYLHQGTMREGDWFLQLDDLERVSVGFVRDHVPILIDTMRRDNVAMVANYGKGLLFRFNDQLEFKGSPHWYGQGFDGRVANIELPQSEFWNVRAEQRPPHHWIGHYARYWVAYPAGSNHALLGLEKQGNPQDLFPIREARRLAFRKLMGARGYPLTLDGLKTFLSQLLDAETKDHLNAEKTLRDYWWMLQGRLDILKDTHLPSDSPPIP